MADTDKEQKES